MKRLMDSIRDVFTSYRKTLILIVSAWVCCFFFLLLFIKIWCRNTDPVSDGFCGLLAKDVSKVIKSLFELYTPYLGIIVGGLTYYDKIKKTEGWLPVIVFMVCIVFNGIIIYTFLNFLTNLTANNLDDFMDDLQMMRLYPPLFISALLSFFFTKLPYLQIRKKRHSPKSNA
ncbi:MAG: hypothetical protein WCS03_03415 [Bacteroidota bacterium]